MNLNSAATNTATTPEEPFDAGSNDMNSTVTTRIRRLAVTVGVTAGLIAASAGPAAAGINLGNHRPPAGRAS
jgi:hypothetical protein